MIRKHKRRFGIKPISPTSYIIIFVAGIISAIGGLVAIYVSNKKDKLCKMTKKMMILSKKTPSD